MVAVRRLTTLPHNIPPQLLLLSDSGGKQRAPRRRFEYALRTRRNSRIRSKGWGRFFDSSAPCVPLAHNSGQRETLLATTAPRPRYPRANRCSSPDVRRCLRRGLEVFVEHQDLAAAKCCSVCRFRSRRDACRRDRSGSSVPRTISRVRGADWLHELEAQDRPRGGGRLKNYDPQAREDSACRRIASRRNAIPAVATAHGWPNGEAARGKG